MRTNIITAVLLLFITQASLASQNKDLLIKFAPGATESMRLFVQSVPTTDGNKVEILTDSWIRLQVKDQRAEKTMLALQNEPAVEYVQPNYKIKLLENYQLQDPLIRAALAKFLKSQPKSKAPADNPAIPGVPAVTTGNDPFFKDQWGMNDIGVKEAWNVTIGNPDMIVAVIDTGVDYTHEDLLPNLWRNNKEIPGNGIDDDGNGYIDDIVGWDFVSNDNKPYDLSVDPAQLLFGGGNPGHGTHCAGNVAARNDNGKGISGVAPNVKIMSLRFISEKGSGTTADAIKAIKYGVDNGAKVLSNSWGSEGEDPAEGAENKALRDVITYAQDRDVLFVAAAGNGHQGVGYDNDSDAQPAFPASYENENIVSVAAIDSSNNLGAFSNWGSTTVDIGAPGVNVFSTMVGNKYSNKVIDIGGFEANWDGTSMAAPHVAGAAALYWSAHPSQSWREVKAALIKSAKKIPALSRKVVSQGKLDVKALMSPSLN